MKELPGVPDAVISNAALGSATVEQYQPDPHKQDLAMLQVLPLMCASTHTVAADTYYYVSNRTKTVASVLLGQFDPLRCAQGCIKPNVQPEPALILSTFHKN